MSSPVSSRTDDSPGQVLLHRFLEPQAVSVQQFAQLAGIPKKTLQNIITGERMPDKVIRRISAITRTAPRFWYYQQAMWLFRKYLESQKSAKAIEVISLPWRTNSIESPGQILDREFIKPSGESFRSIERKYKIQYQLFDIVRGKRAITPLLASQLQNAFGARTRYWLDLQTCDELERLLKVNPIRYKAIAKSLQNFRSDLVRRKFQLDYKRKVHNHPGKILMKQFLMPSEISVNEWHKVLFISTMELKLITSGKRKLSSSVILKLARVFNRDITYWIDLNNAYYSQWADTNLKSLGKTTMDDSVLGSYKPLPPFKFLEDHFLRPMDFPRKRFLRHIGIKGRSYGDDPRVTSRINFELAIRVGQALHVDPHYFVFVQMEYYLFHHGRLNRW